jgi:glycosyltransferase involved in cell wall biosynthesis
MKVIFYVRGNHNEVKGGDLVQLYSTAEYLRKEGIDVELTSDPKKDLSKYDLVHLFNSPRFEETLAFYENARKYSKPVAFSTIYWPKDELAVGAASSRSVQIIRDSLGIPVAKKYRAMMIKIKAGIKNDKSHKIEKFLFKKSDILLPNSKSEMEQIEKYYKVNNQYVVVSNAVDVSLFDEVPNKERKDYVLSVGRIERRKNTLQLIQACKEVERSLVLVGGYEKNDLYAEECLALVKKYNFKHIDNIDQSKLVSYYYEAKVHAIAAWYETPGLASMEAACGGCTVVSTDRGSTKDYFGNDAIYCDPLSRSSIKEAIENAFSKKFTLDLRNKIIRNYTWEKAAIDTIKGYNKIV